MEVSGLVEIVVGGSPIIFNCSGGEQTFVVP